MKINVACASRWLCIAAVYLDMSVCQASELDSDGPNVTAVDSHVGSSNGLVRNEQAIGVSINPTAQSIRTTFLEPATVVVVAAGEPGILAEVHVKEGMQINKGDSLAELDSRVHTQLLKAAKVKAASKAKIDNARAALELQELRCKNFQELVVNGHANKVEIDKIQLELTAAKAAYELALIDYELNQVEVGRIQAQIDQRSIVSPVSGVISVLHRKEGEFLNVSDPKFATIVNTDTLKAKFFIANQDLISFQVGEKVKVYLTSHDKEVHGSVTFVSPVTDADSGTARVEVCIENASKSFRSGIVCFLGSKEEYLRTRDSLRGVRQRVSTRIEKGGL